MFILVRETHDREAECLSRPEKPTTQSRSQGEGGARDRKNFMLDNK